ncbi:SPOR domain-containing protein [Cupriavidus necator]|uniref:SPOR domain-containing protein n=1 Tax=Cupriavidus necator TaxID=106590 RepID=UPI00339D8253
MGLLSLFSSRKGNDPAPERARRQRTDPGAGIASSRRLAEEYADDTLDPEFPQKQRARRRLIGAVVLVVAAVIVLPIVFETKPRPVSDDVAVKVTNGVTGSSQKPKVEPRKADPLPPTSSTSSPRNDAAALDAGEEIVSTPQKPAATAAADKPADKPAQRAEARPEAKPAGSGKYLILIGAFSSEERAKNWLAKLKASKVPAYVEKKVLADGERILLRAGPFSDREAADAADKRVRAVGLTSRVVEQ